MRSAIAPEVEVNIKHRANDPSQSVNVKSNSFARDREQKMIVAHLNHMEEGSIPAQTRL
jgi:hypothetical protein